MSVNIFSPETRPNKRIKRGDIWYIGRTDYDENGGSLQESDRPAIIVSNDACNRFSSVVEVVYMTTRHKKKLPTHVIINSARVRSTALCEQIDSVTIDKLQNRQGQCTALEMHQIDAALAVSLGLMSPLKKY